MPVITRETLDYLNPYYYVDYKTVLRGQQLFRAGQTKIVAFSGDRATINVSDDRKVYTVEMELLTRKQVGFNCDCDTFPKHNYCQHVVASVQALTVYLDTEAADNWEYRLSLVLENAPKKTSGASRARYAMLFGLQKTDYYNSSRYSLHVLVIKSADWPALKGLGEKVDAEDFNQRLDADTSWRRSIQVPYQALHYAGCINLPPEGVSVGNLMIQSGHYYYESSFSNYLPLLARMNAPLYLFDGSKLGERLQILAEPQEVEVALGRASAQPGAESFVLQAGLQVDGKMFTSVKESLDVVTQDPAWVIAGRYLLPVKNPQSLPLLTSLPLTIPAGQEENFRQRFLRDIAERVPVKGDVIAWEDAGGDPLPRLYLKDAEGTLHAALMFAYGDYEIPAQNQPDELSLLDLPGSWGMVRVHRQVDREMEYFQLLTDPQYRLKRAGREYPPGTYELRARAHPFDFLMHSIPLLAKAGFEIFGEEKLKAGKVNRNKPTISLNIRSGLDWFDLDAVVLYGDQSVALRDIRRALRKNEQYVKLADGSIGQIPAEWLERYRHLFELAEETEDGDGLRITDYHLPIVDALLEEAELAQVAPEFEQRRNRLRSFEQILSQPVPVEFQGELRPYQKVGLDWLHFLHDYGFGGCLADDMGLGKTIQVLAFLQSLREQKKLGAACLLVVPKSLIANWQREAARFTPGLRFMVYLGNTRSKDTAAFGDCDIVLTTYGTMLRDIETLRAYRFYYAILDESQAIKNPLALSSKAARLLNAEHRLVLTGTPVENNTFELWSQFTFLNPGLLGNLEFFKREFANPIESDKSQEAAKLLRKLVYPFILRRTKEQVAPELPPRTERILYTDMEAAQKKLYNQTRDRYRGILMGMIEAEGISNVRMKILEGLLRLRQICIHPALVEPAYRGEAPKFELLFDTLQTLRDENHKALVFSQFVETLKMVRKELDARKITYTYLDGQTVNRQAEVDRFQTDESVRFFLISLKAGGVGLNLTAADYVIHLDPWWNPAVEMQASDRAHRIGQDKPVFVYKIITRDTVEEKILVLQERKRELVQQLIAEEESFFKSLSADDVKVLFS